MYRYAVKGGSLRSGRRTKAGGPVGTTARSGGRAAPLSRDVVLAAALALVDEEGADALTLRRLADRLGVNPMAAYHHVHGKDAILDGIAELVTQDIHLRDESGPWQ